MKKSKPTIEFRVAFLEGGKRRLARTKAEKHELDEAIRRRGDGDDQSYKYAEKIITKLKPLLNSRDPWKNEVSNFLTDEASKIQKDLVDGPGFIVARLIDCAEWFTGFMHAVERRDKQFLAKKAKAARRSDLILKLYERAETKTPTKVLALWSSLSPEERRGIKKPSRSLYYQVLDIERKARKFSR